MIIHPHDTMFKGTRC